MQYIYFEIYIFCGKIFWALNMELYEEIERSLITKYQKRIWGLFVKAVKDYNLIEMNLFNSLHNINLDVVNGYRQDKVYHVFNEMYEKMKNESK